MKKIDVSEVVGAVTRQVKNVEREGRPARAVVATRVYDTDINDAWDALTRAERIPQWFLPIEGDCRLGGRYQLQGNAGGVITVCEPPRHLAATWEFGGEVSWIDVRLESVSTNKTRLTLEHTAVIDDARWDEFGPGAAGVGWDLGLLGLYLHFASKGAVVIEEGQAWAAGDDGKIFQRLSSDDWCRASIVSGTDAAKARAAADRTTAAYTGGA